MVPGFHIRSALLLALCCALLIVAAGAACITGGAAEPPTPTPDFEATIRAAVAQGCCSNRSVHCRANAVAAAVAYIHAAPYTDAAPDTDAAHIGHVVIAIAARLWAAGLRQRHSPRCRISTTEIIWNNMIRSRQQPSKPCRGLQTASRRLTRNHCKELLYLATSYPSVFRSLMGLTWVADDINQWELAVVDSVHSAAYYDAALTKRIVNLSWVADGIEPLEPDAVDALWTIASVDADLAERVITLSWVEDGVSELETAAMENLFFMADADAALAGHIVGIPWVEDGVTELENMAVENLSFIANQDVGLGHQVAGMTWLTDDVTDVESAVLEELWRIVYEDAAAARRVVSMPFLESLDPPDVVAMESLASLAYFNAATFREVISHPTFDNGITDEWAPIVATLYNVNEEAPAFVDILLDPAQVTQEWRTVTLPHSGDVDLVIIRTGPGAQRSMDLLENAVRSAEDFMGVPLPTNYVGLLFGNTVSGYSAGTNYSTHVVALAEYDVDDGSRNAEFTGHLIAHEVAHYYWTRGRDWVDEGLSDLMASVAENARTGQPVDVTNDPCQHTDSIAELERLTALGNDEVFECNYSLGEGFFLDLYRHLGDQAFREGMRRLYRMALVEDDADNYDGTSVGIQHIENAFQLNSANVVINRWYHGTVP